MSTVQILTLENGPHRQRDPASLSLLEVQPFLGRFFANSGHGAAGADPAPWLSGVMAKEATWWSSGDKPGGQRTKEPFPPGCATADHQDRRIVRKPEAETNAKVQGSMGSAGCLQTKGPQKANGPTAWMTQVLVA